MLVDLFSSANFITASSFCFNIFASLANAIALYPCKDRPVPAGINLPTITFSFKPTNLSDFPPTAASVKTLVVSWNDAAEMKEDVDKLALVIPCKTGFDNALFNFFPKLSFSILNSFLPLEQKFLLA